MLHASKVRVVLGRGALGCRQSCLVTQSLGAVLAVQCGTVFESPRIPAGVSRSAISELASVLISTSRSSVIREAAAWLHTHTCTCLLAVATYVHSFRITGTGLDLDAEITLGEYSVAAGPIFRPA